MASVCLLVLVIGLPVWLICRAEHQARLDYRLIQAIKADDTPTILEALQAGADGNARDLGKPPVSLRGTLLRLVNRWKQASPEQHILYRPTALCLLLTPHLPSTSSPDFLALLTWPPPPPENVPVVKMLLAQGADISERDDEQKTPVMRALEFKWMETVRLLVEAGASPNIQDGDDEPPLTYADAKGAATLIKYGANVNARCPGGRTPLMKALCPPNVHLDAVLVLLAEGADATAGDDFGMTPLMLATLFTDTATMQSLFAHGADANKGDIAGETPLIGAVLCKDVDKVKLLLEHGAQTAGRDAEGVTALSWAQKVHARQIVVLLVQAGARK